MSGWEVAAPVMLGVLLLGLLIFSIVKPSSRVMLGVFVERKLMNGEKESPAPPPPPADEAPTKEIRRPDAW